MGLYKHAVQSLHLTLAFLLATPPLALADDGHQPIEWIYPGQPVPASIPVLPLKVSSSGNADVSVNARDWFLLKDRRLNLQNPTVGKTLDYVGPKLNSENGRTYYRLIAGSILKETLIEMKMNSAEARRFMERTEQQGKDFDKTPLNELGELPQGFQYLYANWDREATRLNVLPYLLLPLAIASHSSQFQHFYEDSVNDTKEQRTCSTINTAEPLAPIQSKIDEQQKSLDSLGTAVRDAAALKQQSANEQTRLGNLITDFSKQIGKATDCFNVFSNRVARGGGKPDQSCMQLAASAIDDAVKNSPHDETKIRNAWQTFTKTNLSNDEGDISKRNRLDAELKANEARLEEARKSLTVIQDDHDKIQAGLNEKLDKIKTINRDLADQKKQSDDLTSEQSSLLSEQRQIQDLNYKVETGALPPADSSTVKAIGDTGTRNKSLMKIQNRVAQITDSINKIQANQTALYSQLDFLNRSVDSDRAQVKADDQQLAQQKPKVEELENLVKKSTPIYQAAADQAAISEFVLSLLTNKLNTLTQTNNGFYTSLKKEQVDMAGYETQLTNASQAEQTNTAGIQNQIDSLKKLIASYHDQNQMGWFLEDDCEAREHFAHDGAALYLSRAPIEKTYVANSRSPALPTTPVDGGRWGLFNLDYTHFQAPIQNGVLLNVPAYVQLAVHQIIEDYDYVMTQYFDPSAPKCSEAETPRLLSSALPSLMRSAYLVWNEGSDADAKSRALACHSLARGSDAKLATEGQSFQSDLLRLMSFTGSLLDQTLPQEGRSRSEDLIERHAISLVAQEMSILAGTSRPEANVTSAQRRDALIKALIRVLAYDYTAKTHEQNEKQSDPHQVHYEFATVAPGTNAATKSSVVLQPGAVLPIKTIGAVKLYTGPNAQGGHDTGITLSLNDQVEVVATEEAGWVRVKAPYATDKEVWMAAWPIQSSTLMDENGRALNHVTDLENCPDPRLVTSLNNYRRTTVIERYSANIKTVPVNRWKKIWEISPATPRVAPAAKGRLYLACDTFSVPNQLALAADDDANLGLDGVDSRSVQAIRIVQAEMLRAANGQVVYLPTESDGGYVSAWAFDRRGAHPQITLGDHIDPKTWSVKK